MKDNPRVALEPITRRVFLYMGNAPQSSAVISWRVPSDCMTNDRVVMTRDGNLEALHDPWLRFCTPSDYFEMAKVLEDDYHHPKGYEITITVGPTTYRVVMADNPSADLSARAEHAFKNDKDRDGVMFARAAGWMPHQACAAMGMRVEPSAGATWDDADVMTWAPDYAKVGLSDLRGWRQRESVPYLPVERPRMQYIPVFVRPTPPSYGSPSPEQMDRIWGTRGITYDRDDGKK